MRKHTLVTSLGVVLVLLLAGTARALEAPAYQVTPAFKAGSTLGADVWHDSDGLHARFRTRGELRHFTGKVSTASTSELPASASPSTSRSTASSSRRTRSASARPR